MTAISDLLERVQKATGPDRELDVLIDCIVRDDREVRTAEHPQFGRQLLAKNKKPPHDEYWADHPANAIKPYTASIDAALALVERKLPGWSARVYVHPSAAYADLYRLGELTHFPEGKIERRVTTPYFEGHRIEHRLPALAILAALLRALESETPA